MDLLALLNYVLPVGVFMVGMFGLFVLWSLSLSVWLVVKQKQLGHSPLSPRTRRTLLAWAPSLMLLGRGLTFGGGLIVIALACLAVSFGLGTTARWAVGMVVVMGIGMVVRKAGQDAEFLSGEPRAERC